jgi:hypothetical protein
MNRFINLLDRWIDREKLHKLLINVYGCCCYKVAGIFTVVHCTSLEKRDKCLHGLAWLQVRMLTGDGRKRSIGLKPVGAGDMLTC